MEATSAAYKIMDILITKDANGRPSRQYSTPAKEVFSELPDGTVSSLEKFCSIIRDMHAVSLINAGDKTEVNTTTIETQKLNLEATEIGIREYLDVKRRQMKC